MSRTQELSVITSHISLCSSFLLFIVERRRSVWINPQHPQLASILPIFLLVSSSIASGVQQFRYFEFFRNFSYFSFDLFIIMNTFSVLFTIFVLCVPQRIQWLSGRQWIIARTTVHLLFSTACMINLIAYYYKMPHGPRNWFTKSVKEWGVYLFRLVISNFIIHFLFGLVIFSGINIAGPFSVVLSFPVFLLRKLANLCCCCFFSDEKRDAFNERLDMLLRPAGTIIENSSWMEGEELKGEKDQEEMEAMSKDSAGASMGEEQAEVKTEGDNKDEYDI